MKFDKKHFFQCISNATFLSALGLSIFPMSLQAVTPEEGRKTYIWQGFQGGMDHTGNIPVSILVNNTPSKLPNWTVPPLVTAVKYDEELATFHSNGSTVNAVEYIYLHTKLNQPTITESEVLLTNSGYLEPFVFTHIDKEDGRYSNFEYISADNSDTYNSSGTWNSIYCPQSQSQPVFSDGVAYLTTNYYKTDPTARFCTLDYGKVLEQHADIRVAKIGPDKAPAGSEVLRMTTGENTRYGITAHLKDQFLSPVWDGSTLYTQAGGVATSRNYTGVYSISNQGTANVPVITNNWSGINTDGFIQVAPNSYWSPAVNSTSVFTFLNGTSSHDYENNIPTLTQINKSTGVVTTQQLGSFEFRPTQETSFNVYNMESSPVLINDQKLVVINNGYLVFFDVSGNQYYAAPTPIEGEFYGQPNVSQNIIYLLSRDQSACNGYASCIRAISAISKSPVKDSNGDTWVWTPPSPTENLEFPFVTTNSHIFVSSDAGYTYGVKSARTITNASRLEMSYPLDGKLGFSYDTLFIAHSANDVPVTQSAYWDLQVTRPYINDSDIETLANNLNSAWATHNSNPATFANVVKSNNASVIVALQFPIDTTQTADLDVDLSITAPSAGAVQAEVGQVITYSAVITNRGSLDATNVVATAIIPGAVELLTDSISGDVACDYTNSLLTCDVDGDTSSSTNTLAVSDSASFQFSVIPRVESTITMSVSADGSELNPDLDSSTNDDNTASVQITSTPASASNHNLSVSIDATSAYQVNIGKIITYVITVTNAIGSDTALDVQLDFAVNSTAVEEIIDAGTCTLTNCTISNMIAGQTRTFTIQTQSVGAGQGGINAQISSTRDEQTDTDTSNNSANFNLTQVSKITVTENASDLPKASGAFDWLLLLGFAPLLASRRKSK